MPLLHHHAALFTASLFTSAVLPGGGGGLCDIVMAVSFDVKVSLLSNSCCTGHTAITVVLESLYCSTPVCRSNFR